MPFEFPRVQAIPTALDEVSLSHQGINLVRYNCPSGAARPFFHPVLGLSGRPLTRLGHPNPVGHEHHKSIWFGHQKINDANFWEEKPDNPAQVKHRRVTILRDGSDFAGFAAELEWSNGQRIEMLHQLIAVLEPLGRTSYTIDIQSRFSCPSPDPVKLGKTNFGFLGVRVAKTISEQSGGGRLLNSEGAQGEASIFGKPARWVDYSGPSAPDAVEGITYLDHPSNPGHPTCWHVRGDGWMEAAFNLASEYLIPPDHPLELRYRLFVHAGDVQKVDLDRAWEAFAATVAYRVIPPTAENIATLRRA